jgi:regulator of cell morphogenesis and NO signaling
MINPHVTVDRLVLEYPECATVLLRHRIDIWRRDRSLADACRYRGLDLGVVVGELERAIADHHGAPGEDLERLSNRALAAHLASQHRDRLLQALPFVRGLSAKVASVHGPHNPRLREVADAVSDLDQLLGDHLDDEEAGLFVAISARPPDLTTIGELLVIMQSEHAAIRASLATVRAATEDYRVPDWACASYRLLFSELERLEGNVWRQSELEDRLLPQRFGASEGGRF